jgi:ATP-dependent DNA helicase RecQ
MTTPATILKNTFGYDTFRPLQEEVIENILNGNDTLAIMPTGGGKSLCYQIPSILLDGLTVVVSPLISLMKDQVDQLRANGIFAVTLNSSLTPQHYQENLQWIQDGSAKILYVAPETLLTPRVISLLSTLKLSLLTIDEAHCISEWGHDFRPEYRQLISIRQQFPKAVCLALTATATTRVRNDIKKSLNFKQSNEFVASFNRENLYIEVSPKEEPLEQTMRVLRKFTDQSGIIYCFSRKQVDDLAATLANKGYSVRPYHAGLSDMERKANQEAFIRDDVQIIVATIAFGMGINKPNVRFIIHYDLPKSIESYYQEIGRAGRDGLPAYCLLLYSYSDVAKLKYFIKQKEGNEKRVATQHLDAMIQYAEDENHCRRKPLLTYFGETYADKNCNNCDNCNASVPTLVDITIPAQKFLSCVKRCDESFGTAHIVNVLRGSKAEKILAHGHDKLSTYGIGSDLNTKQWMNLSRQLIQLGYLSKDPEFQTLALTPKAISALKQRTTIMGHFMEDENKSDSSKLEEKELTYNHALYFLLREKRKEIANENGVPPYVIFSDKTLIEMCAYYPQSEESLLGIHGVGQAKLSQFGESFLEVIRNFCQKKGLSEIAKPGQKVSTSIGLRTTHIGDSYNQGNSITQLMEQHQVKANTILKHLEMYVSAGNRLRSDDDIESLCKISSASRNEVYQVFSEVGSSLLKPVFEKLNGKISYDDLRILRLCYLINQSNKS